MENSKKKRIESVEIEMEGKTVEEAVKKAENLLKVSKNEFKIKVLSEEQKGLFGMEGSKPAKIRVSLLHHLSLPKKNS